MIKSCIAYRKVSLVVFCFKENVSGYIDKIS